jgi:hypothetical protein
MSEPIEVQVGRHIARGRIIVLQWLRRYCWGLKANLPTPLAHLESPSSPILPGSNTEFQHPGPTSVNPIELREVEERAIRRFCRELSSHSIQRRHELIQKKLLDLSLGKRPGVAI